MGVEQNKAALMRAVEAWNSGEVARYLELYGAEIKLHAGTYDFADKKAVEDMYKGFFARRPICDWISMRRLVMRTSLPRSIRSPEPIPAN